MSEALVTIENLSKEFAPGALPALTEINVIIPKGEIIGLAGPDGAGKTTLIRLIAGLLLPTKGTITVSGYDTVKYSRIRPFFNGVYASKVRSL